MTDINFKKFYTNQQSSFVKPAREFASSLKDFIANGRKPNGASLPWSKTHPYIDFKPGRTTVWAGTNKAGKSILVGQALLDWIDQGVVIASLEMDPDQTLARMVAQHVRREPKASDVDGFTEKFGEKLQIYDRLGVASSEDLIGFVRWAASNGNKHVVIDSLMMLSIKPGDFDAQTAFMAELMAAAKDEQTHVHLICHMNKQGFDTTDDLIGSRVHIKGASEITNMADACFVLMRNRKKEYAMGKAISNAPMTPDERKAMDGFDAYLRLDANRHYGAEKTFGLMFDPRGEHFYEDHSVAQHATRVAA